MARRLITLEKMNWSTKKVSRVAQVLVDQAMSSEESCVEVDEVDGRGKTVAYQISKLSWESERFAKAKRVLDDKYQSNLAQRCKDRLLPRHVSDQQSARTLPDKFPNWATIL